MLLFGKIVFYNNFFLDGKSAYVTSTEKQTCMASSQKTIHEFGMSKYSSQHVRQLEGDMVLMTAIARSGLPYSIVDEQWFKEMIGYFNPRLNVKHSTTFAKYKMPMLYGCVMDAMKNEIERDMQTCQTVAFTTDCWTSQAEDPYITLTLHYINDNFQLKKFVINFENFVGRHTGYHIAKVSWIFFTRKNIPYLLVKMGIYS